MKSVYAACGASLAIGLFFIFVWAPHPWGWEGIDQYHDLALALAAGRPFPTMEVPWGYAYFVAAFYRLFGARPVVPLVVQVALNGVVPLLTFVLARRWFDRRTAVVAAVLTGLFSFNTIYASTESSDAVCTVLFMSAVALFARALRRPGWALFAAAGAITGIASQFRPNLILIPALLAAWAVWQQRSVRRAIHAAVLLAAAALMLTPWVVRNYQLTKTLLPTSVHGGVQLWYGTLQVGPYLNSRAYNPRSDFETPVFDYTSLADVPLVVSADSKGCARETPAAVRLTYWTDVDPARRSIAPSRGSATSWAFEIPPPHRDAVVYYYFDTISRDGGDTPTPSEGAAAPFVYFVTQNHLGDQDVRSDFVDVFDLVRAARARAWGEPVSNPRLEEAGIRPDDPAQIARALAANGFTRSQQAAAAVAGVDHDDKDAVLRFADGSSMTIPRRWSSKITDVVATGSAARALMHAHVRVTALVAPHQGPAPNGATCADLEAVTVNGVFYRREPESMRRYSALAWDNIRREPIAFAAASAYRALRLFVVYGEDDPHTAQQFSGSRRVYLAATAVSLAYALLAAAGAVIAWRRREPVGLPLLLVLYVPATIAPVLTNMRYTVTVQPIVFMFVASALVALFNRRAPAPAAAAPTRAGSRTERSL